MSGLAPAGPSLQVTLVHADGENQGFPSCKVHGAHLGARPKARSDSGGLGWAVRHCVSGTSPSSASQTTFAGTGCRESLAVTESRTLQWKERAKLQTSRNVTA